MASIEHRIGKSGENWRVIWWENGARERVVFDDAGDAARFKMLVEGSGNRWPEGWQRPTRVTPPTSTGRLTFGRWAERAIDARARANERTKADYRRDLARHFAILLPVPLDDLSTGHVIAWLADRRGAHLSEKTLRNLHGFGSSVMADAVSQHPPIATHNPFTDRLAKRGAIRTEEMVFFTPGEFDLIHGRVPDERGYRELIRLLYGLGLRYGEATALTVRDVDLLGKRKTVTVTKAWKRTGTAAWQVGEPKTSRSRRTLSLSPELVDMLIPFVSGKRGDELVFPGAGGGRLPHSEVYKRAWAPAVARARVCDTHYAEQKDGRGKPPRLPQPCDCAGTLDKTPRIHDIRHSWVSALISEGIALEVISRRAGHSSITITFDRYGHLDPRHDAVVDAATDRVLTRQPTS